jgi:hypothetical protein
VVEHRRHSSRTGLHTCGTYKIKAARNFGVKLVGRLVPPTSGGRTSIVVPTHDFEDDSARDSYPLRRLLPAEVVGAFV